MKRLLIIFIVAFVYSSCANEKPKQNNRQRFGYCSLESCYDEMSADVMVNPRPDQEGYIRQEPDPFIPGLSRAVSTYSLDKNNWVVRIRLVTVPHEDDIQVFHDNSVITQKQKDYCNSFTPTLYWNNVVFTAAKVTSDIVITADCELYGRPAGTNLADKFLIPYFPKELYSDEQYLVSYDEPAIIADLFQEDSAPMALTDYFFPGVMVHRGFWLQPADVYEEDPEIIHFHLEYDAWTDLFEPYADYVTEGFVQKGPNRHLYADFEVEITDYRKVEGWKKNELYKYPW